MKYLIAIDSDGTLRHSDGTISGRTKDVICKIRDQGNVVVICTARPRYHTSKISKEIGVNEYYISSNGSEVYDDVNSSIVWAAFLKKEECQILYDYAKKNDIRIMFVLENTEYVTQFTRNENQILLDDRNFHEVLSGNIKQAMIIGKDKEKILSFKNVVEERYKLNVMDSSNMDKEEMWFSAGPSNASKGIAILNLVKYLNIEDLKIIAIGNDSNDLPMFKIADYSVAVDNANDEIKKYASCITESNDLDGVASYLEKFFDL